MLIQVKVQVRLMAEVIQTQDAELSLVSLMLRGGIKPYEHQLDKKSIHVYTAFPQRSGAVYGMLHTALVLDIYLSLIFR